MTIDELLQVYRRYHDKVGCAGDECYVCAAQEAYEQAKKPVMGEVCPSGSRIGSTEAEVQSHAGSNPATSPANTALVQKLVDALGFYADTNNWKVEVTVDGCGCCTTARSVIKTDMGKIANAALTEATAYLKQQEGKASEGVENALEIYEFAYEKYGEHVVALRNSPQGGGVQLFNTVKLFAENNSLKEYERVKDEAADFAKKFVEQFNAPNQQPAQQGKRAEGGAVDRTQRRVVCAAIRKNGVIIHAPRHFDMTMHHYIETWRLAGNKETMADAEQGFIDQWGKFMSREEALEVATAARQILDKTGDATSKQLFSEDLY